ncbi:putative holin protein [Bacillus phage BCP78]|uniref:Putative holin protein n=3 Tax=Tsarbombavirus BCP78 TaxID=1985182 RepID=J9PQN8_9CAUD|nr:holin [Bacillus phage BCP78]YP_009783515.1 putative holin protein [Bacillus phage BCU4]AEW47159.1 putative holin protein [Bacillus phage BCP78]AEW47648.1 putative holin protein [Bacillus phage BCU4]AQN32527.1 putative holin protein [Bacillus phage BCP12]
MEENKQVQQEEQKHVEHSVFVPVEVPKVEPMVIVRLLVFAVALINAVAAMFGYNLGLEVDQQNMYDIISALFLLGSGFYATWKNNNISKQARVQAHVAKQVSIDNKKGE